MPSPSILLATTNAAKQQKLRWLLADLPLMCRTPEDLGMDASFIPDETGEGHQENACMKALAWSKAASVMAISSDGGLVIPALGDRWRSLFTHRIAVEGSDQDRVNRLLELMQPYKGEERQASWVEALAIAKEGQILASWQVQGASGYVSPTPGPLASVPGFWVFTIWYLPQVGKRYIELDDQELGLVEDHWTRLRSLVHNYFGERAQR